MTTVDNARALINIEHIPDPIAFVERFGLSIAKSGIFGCSNAEQGHVIAMAILCPKTFEIARRYNIIQGILSMKADAMLADFDALGGTHKLIARNEHLAHISLSIDGQTEEFALTWEDAQKEPFVYGKGGKIKTNWATPRARMQMLWARVVSDGVRAMRPGIVAGFYTPEEVGDFNNSGDPPPSRPATDAVVKQAAAVARPSEPAVVVEAVVEEIPFDVVETPPLDDVMVSQLRTLFKHAKIPIERQEILLREYGVGTVRSLTVENAKALRQRLADHIKETASKTMTPNASEAGYSASTQGPCTGGQCEEIASLAEQIQAFDPDITDRIRAKLGVASGSIQHALTHEKAAKLIETLKQKIIKQQVGTSLAGKQKSLLPN